MMDAVQKALRVAKADGGGNVQGAPDAGVPAAGPDYSGFVSGLYQSELGRAPEAAGLQGWVNALQSGQMTQDQVRQQVLQSPENQVQDLYQQILNRAPDPDASNWVNAIQSGGMTLPQVREAIGQSPENQVQDLYSSLLGRSLDPGASQWIQGIGSGKMTGEQVKQAIMDSAEYKAANPTAATGTTASGTSGTTTGSTTTPVDITKQGMPLIYTPPPYKDYGATAAAFRVASGLENLPAPFYTLSPVSGGTPSAGGATAPAGGGTTYQDILKQIAATTPTTTKPETTTTTPATTTKPATTETPYLSDIASLYKTYLGRTPEAGAAENWANAIKSGQLTYNEVVNAIKSSPEYNQNQITNAYQQYLGRAPESTGLQGWANAVNSGQISINDALAAIKGSQEAQGLGAATVPAATATPVATPAANAVAAAYQQYLGRSPEPGAAEAWQGAIASGAMTPEQVIAAIASSAEAQSFYTPDYYRKDGGAVKGYADGGGTDYEDLVNAAYQNFLGRSPDDAGFKSWLSALTSGAIAPADFESRFKGAGYEDDIVSTYQNTLDRSPSPAEISNWNTALTKGDMTLDQVMQKINMSPEATSMPAYRNVPEPDRFSERQGGRMYDIDIGRNQRIPELGRMAAPVNVKQAFENSEIERLKKELEAAKVSGNSQVRDMGGGGGGGEGGSNFGASDSSGTAGAIGVDSAAGAQGPGMDSSGASGVGEGTGGLWARGGRTGNNAVNNALRMLKADRR